jgi:putative FmdB family regulatory protein
MPLFDFACNECKRPFEELLRSSDLVGEVSCPYCGSPLVKKKLSTFASKVSGAGSISFGYPSSSCGSGST